MAKESRFRLGITHGDVNGIGYEVILKALSDQRMLESMTPIIYGSSKAASYHRKTIKTNVNFQSIQHLDEASAKAVNVLNVTNEEIRIELGTTSPASGEIAVLALRRAMTDLKEGRIDAMVTAPIDKKAVQSESFRYSGHTEFLAAETAVKDYLMLMVSPQLRIGMVTGHIPLSSVAGALTQEKIESKLNILDYSLRQDFGVIRPRIAVLGLNPHASDDGLLGEEEHKIISPVIERANASGKLVFGPYPSDGFFGAMGHLKFDGVLAMYHDQGLIPFKLTAFHEGVNFTAGLPVIRTSPAHGTAFDIAGKDIANHDSMLQAIFLAQQIYENRLAFLELQAAAMR